MSAPWPNLFIVGAPRCGTTSLYHYLASHPDVAMSTQKEPNFLTGVAHDASHWALRTLPRDETEYLALFPDRPAAVVGEASPSYLWHEASARLIRERSPHARVIVMVRDPVERAFSHYLMGRRFGYFRRTFRETLERTMTAPTPAWFDPDAHPLVDTGAYAKHVRRFQDALGKEAVLVLTLDELARETSATMARVARFLGIDAAPFAGTREFAVHEGHREPRGALAPRVFRSEAVWRLRRLVPAAWRSALSERVLLRRAPKPAIDEQSVALMRPVYEASHPELERLLGRSLPELRRAW